MPRLPVPRLRIVGQLVRLSDVCVAGHPFGGASCPAYLGGRHKRCKSCSIEHTVQRFRNIGDDRDATRASPTFDLGSRSVRRTRIFLGFDPEVSAINTPDRRDWSLSACGGKETGRVGAAFMAARPSGRHKGVPYILLERYVGSDWRNTGCNGTSRRPGDNLWRDRGQMVL